MKTIELKGSEKYVEWMRENEGKYKVVRIAATNLSSSAWAAALGCAIQGERVFTITCEEKN